MLYIYSYADLRHSISGLDIVTGNYVHKPKKGSRTVRHVRNHEPYTAVAAYVSIRQHTSAYVSVRQHTSAAYAKSRALYSRAAV